MCINTSNYTSSSICYWVVVLWVGFETTIVCVLSYECHPCAISLCLFTLFHLNTSNHIFFHIISGLKTELQVFVSLYFTFIKCIYHIFIICHHCVRWVWHAHHKYVKMMLCIIFWGKILLQHVFVRLSFEFSIVFVI